MRKIPQIVRAESTSFIVPVYSSVSSQPPYEIHLPVNTVLVLFFLVFYSGDTTRVLQEHAAYRKKPDEGEHETPRYHGV